MAGSIVLSMFRPAFMASFFLVVAGLLTIGFVSWFRTGPIRRGTTPQARDPPGNASFRASRSTLLAALAGISAMAWGGSAPSQHLAEAVPLVGVGAFIAVAGSVARVTNVCADRVGLVVVYARRPPFHVLWSELRALIPPANPLGCWRLTKVGRARSTLMPSDLFGHEELLETIVVRAGLRFDGRIWTKDPAEACGEGPMAPGINLRKRRAFPSWLCGRRSGRSTSLEVER